MVAGCIKPRQDWRCVAALGHHGCAIVDAVRCILFDDARCRAVMIKACLIAWPKKLLLVTSTTPWLIAVADAIAFSAGSFRFTMTTREICTISSGRKQSRTRLDISARVF